LIDNKYFVVDVVVRYTIMSIVGNLKLRKNWMTLTRINIYKISNHKPSTSNTFHGTIM